MSNTLAATLLPDIFNQLAMKLCIAFRVLQHFVVLYIQTNETSVRIASSKRRWIGVQ
ncbi:hypothetical protein [Ammoniphilus sp. 3BR4]|uniref:hypothetical protein n=1 Tax=Ammoniphilus sp. 3BR4 TaxID=3158265 RepID=UPI0034679868